LKNKYVTKNKKETITNNRKLKHRTKHEQHGRRECRWIGRVTVSWHSCKWYYVCSRI